MFGKDQHFELPLVLDAGKNILVNGQSGDKITVSKFSPGAEPQQRVVSSSVEDVIRAIVDLGGTYPDVVQALQQAKKDGSLTSRFAVDALPQSGRQYDHDASARARRSPFGRPGNRLAGIADRRLDAAAESVHPRKIGASCEDRGLRSSDSVCHAFLIADLQPPQLFAAMLKALELAGFKSFADRTRFEFPRGVSVVVGPNGSGKSNVVDAVKWVLGSQSAKSLRGREMTDVIFNGSASRGPLGAGEATLTFDNSRRPAAHRRPATSTSPAASTAAARVSI